MPWEDYNVPDIPWPPQRETYEVSLEQAMWGPGPRHMTVQPRQEFLALFLQMLLIINIMLQGLSTTKKNTYAKAN